MSNHNAIINAALMKVARRAETVDRHTLFETFVDVGPLSALLTSIDHQILFGRRGTGKTHALFYLAERQRAQADVAVYVDLRTIGEVGLYDDPSSPLSDRGARLLIDTLESIHTSLLAWVIEAEPDTSDELLRSLDSLAESMSSVEVVGQTEREESASESVETQGTIGGQVGVSGPFSFSAGLSRKDLRATDFRIRQSGLERHRVLFGPIGRHLQQFADALAGRRIWILIDEWSSIPAELQPLLADLLRRSLFTVRGITLKIAAIERRSVFRLSRPNGDYLGIEVGSDASAGINLDDFMVFDNESTRSEAFFRELLYRHSVDELGEAPGTDKAASSATYFVRLAFKRGSFAEFVRAAQGVPRDAINLAALAAQRAGTASMSITDVRSAAKDWYLRDKVAALTGHRRALELLRRIVDEVVGQMKTRTFLLDTLDDALNPILQDLYDARLLHVLKRGITWPESPGVLYDGYALDYGCYVSLLLQGNPFDSEAGAVERMLRDDDLYVPPDAFRKNVLSLRDLISSSEPH